MPKIRQTETQIQNACLRRAISGSAGYFQLTVNELAEIAGVKRATWYRRLHDPGEFTVCELRRMIKRYSWDAKTVCEFLGVKEESR